MKIETLFARKVEKGYKKEENVAVDTTGDNEFKYDYEINDEVKAVEGQDLYNKESTGLEDTGSENRKEDHCGRGDEEVIEGGDINDDQGEVCDEPSIPDLSLFSFPVPLPFFINGCKASRSRGIILFFLSIQRSCFFLFQVTIMGLTTRVLLIQCIV